MGKKRRIFKAPQKFKTKFGNHPRMKQMVEESEIVVEEFEPIVAFQEKEKKPTKKAAPTVKKTTRRKSKKATKRVTEK